MQIMWSNIYLSAHTEPPPPCYENCINSGVSGWDCMSRCNGATDGIDDNTNGDQNNDFGNSFLISIILVQLHFYEQTFDIIRHNVFYILNI